jgi:hypothetical protein
VLLLRGETDHTDSRISIRHLTLPYSFVISLADNDKQLIAHPSLEEDIGLAALSPRKWVGGCSLPIVRIIARS